MQCKTCEYPLWNLKARQCPECGSAFLPSQFEFTINSVRFCCPHCNQGYYGTGMSGHLSPSTFECVKCQQVISMDEMVLLPAEGVKEHQTRVELAPWLERKREGRIRSWFKTVWMSLFMPHRLIRGVPVDGGAGQAWWFAAVTASVYSVVSVLPFLLIIGIYTIGTPRTNNPTDILSLAIGMLTFFFSVMIGLLLLAGLWGLVAHGVLLVTGGAPRTLGRTYHAVCYSLGASALVMVPCFGLYFFAFAPMLWWMVSVIVMLAVGHEKLHTGRSILAGGALPVLILILLVGGFVAMMVAGISQVQLAAARANSSATASSQQFHSDLQSWAVTHDGAMPAFGLELIGGDPTRLSDFITEISFTEASNTNIGGTTLEGLALLPPGRLRERINAIADQMPDDVIAHRIGDFVFTYHGVTFPPQDGALWTVVMTPSGQANFSMPGTTNMARVMQADGGLQSYSSVDLSLAMTRQNELRAAHGLEPLPDLQSITLAAPVVRAGGVREAFPVVTDEPSP